MATPSAGEAFRIVILAEPSDTAITPPERVAVCSPGRRLSSRRSLSEPATTYEVGQQVQPLAQQEVKLLAQGRILSALALTVGPEEVFVAGQETRLDLLAADILQQADLKSYCSALSLALSAPAPPSSYRLEELWGPLGSLLNKAHQALKRLPQGGQRQEAEASLDRLRQLADSTDQAEFLRRISSTYHRLADWAEDVYLARALLEQPALLLELLRLRHYLDESAIPLDAGDLTLDRALLQKQVAFALLVAEPHRFSGLQSSFSSYRKRYEAAYKRHHDQYWLETLAIHSRLLDASLRVEALRRINTLTELGPPVGEGAAAAFSQLLEATSGCQLSGRLDQELGDSPVCPSCRLTLEGWPPAERADEVLGRLDRAIRRQLARLSATAVQQVLQRSGDPRVEQFLKVVQASQISSLADLLDDSLLGFLRRFLVEARIQAVLQPIISRLQTGPPPKEEEAEQVMREVTRLLQRAFRAARRSLPVPAQENELPAP